MSENKTAENKNKQSDNILEVSHLKKYFPIKGGMFGKQVGAVKAVDDKTFEVTLTTDLPYFEELCAFPAMMPVRQDIIEAKGDQWTFDLH